MAFSNRRVVQGDDVCPASTSGQSSREGSGDDLWEIDEVALSGNVKEKLRNKVLMSLEEGGTGEGVASPRGKDGPNEGGNHLRLDEVEKKRKKKERNKESARKHREKEKRNKEESESKIRALERENAELRRKLRQYENEPSRTDAVGASRPAHEQVLVVDDNSTNEPPETTVHWVGTTQQNGGDLVIQSQHPTGNAEGQEVTQSPPGTTMGRQATQSLVWSASDTEQQAIKNIERYLKEPFSKISLKPTQETFNDNQLSDTSLTPAITSPNPLANSMQSSTLTNARNIQNDLRRPVDPQMIGGFDVKSQWKQLTACQVPDTTLVSGQKTVGWLRGAGNRTTNETLNFAGRTTDQPSNNDTSSADFVFRDGRDGTTNDTQTAGADFRFGPVQGGLNFPGAGYCEGMASHPNKNDSVPFENGDETGKKNFDPSIFVNLPNKSAVIEPQTQVPGHGSGVGLRRGLTYQEPDILSKVQTSGMTTPPEVVPETMSEGIDTTDSMYHDRDVHLPNKTSDQSWAEALRSALGDDTSPSQGHPSDSHPGNDPDAGPLEGDASAENPWSVGQSDSDDDRDLLLEFFARTGTSTPSPTKKRRLE